MENPTTKSQYLNTQLPLVVIVGETASGKSSLALELAKRLEGEIISADSRMVYRGMDIGTAKPSKADRSKTKHHLLDIVNPDEKFTVADFKQLALKSIAQIRSNHKIPILVGGTGLYIDSVVYDYNFRAKYDTKIRAKLEAMTTTELIETANKSGYANDISKMNRRGLISLLEVGVNNHDDRNQLIENVIILGLKISRTKLRKDISSRVELMFRSGLRREVDNLVKKYGWGHESLTGIGYREFEDYYARKTSLSDVKRKIVQHTLNYAKRQRTWFKRNTQINWFDNPTDATKYVLNILEQEQV